VEWITSQQKDRLRAHGLLRKITAAAGGRGGGAEGSRTSSLALSLRPMDIHVARPGPQGLLTSCMSCLSNIVSSENH
jgi:hypothetical protein